MAEEQGNKFIKGAAVLAAAGLFTKILGAVFRIPLASWIGAEGMSYYGIAYTIYGALVVMATAGLPIAISRMVSDHIAKGEYRYAHQVFRVSLVVMLVIGVASFLICFSGADAISGFMKNPKAAYGMRAIAPALIFVPLFSSFRGYFNGRQNMKPTALSEISEQLVRVVSGLFLAHVLISSGLHLAAAGAAFGATAGSIAGLVVIFVIYMLTKKPLMEKIESGSQKEGKPFDIAKALIWIAIPIIIGSEMMPIMNLIDSGMIMRLLQESGWSEFQSKYMYGLISGFCSPLIALPWIVTQAVGVSLVPAISRSYGTGDMDDVHKHVRLGYRMTMLLGIPCALGMAVLALPILKLLYFSRPDECVDAAPLLIIMSFGIIFSSNMQASTSVLQAVGKQMIPVRNLFIGCVGKFVVTMTLLTNRGVNIKGAAIGTVTAYLIAMLLNEMSVRKYTGVKIDYVMTYVKPLIASAVMALSAIGVYKAISLIADVDQSLKMHGIATLLAVMAAVIVYIAAIFITHSIEVDELKEFPHGDKLEKIARIFTK